MKVQRLVIVLSTSLKLRIRYPALTTKATGMVFWGRRAFAVEASDRRTWPPA